METTFKHLDTRDLQVKAVTEWNANIAGKYCIVDIDSGLVVSDGFETEESAQMFLRLMLLF